MKKPLFVLISFIMMLLFLPCCVLIPGKEENLDSQIQAKPVESTQRILAAADKIGKESKAIKPEMRFEDKLDKHEKNNQLALGPSNNEQLPGLGVKQIAQNPDEKGDQEKMRLVESSIIRGIGIVSKDRSDTPSFIHIYDHMIAVVIGIDTYENLSPNDYLSYAVKDAKGVESVLRSNCMFDRIITLYNKDATRDNIMKILQGELATTGPDDAVFVYFAGHGVTRPMHTGTGELGYLIPYDGSLSRYEIHRNISMQQIRGDVCPLIPAKHVFFVMDACFGGLLLDQRAVVIKPGRDAAYLREITAEPVRQVLAAGQANETVLDGGPRGHSVFTGRLIQAIEKMKDYMTARELINTLSKEVYGDAVARGHKQRPRGGSIYGTGDFVFVSSYEQKLWGQLLVTQMDLKKAQERREQLSRILKSLLKDERMLRKQTKKLNLAAQERQMQRQQTVFQAKKAAYELEKKRTEKEVRQKAELHAELERQLKERTRLQRAIKDLEKEHARRPEALESKTNAKLTKIQGAKEAELLRVKELMKRIKQKRKSLESMKLQSLTITDAIQESKKIRLQMSEININLDQRLAIALQGLKRKYDNQRQGYTLEIEKLDNILIEYNRQIDKMKRRYYDNKPEKNMFETEKQFQKRLAKYLWEADRRVAMTGKNFTDTLKALRTQKKEYVDAMVNLEDQLKRARSDLGNKIVMEKKNTLAIYERQLRDILNQTFTVPTSHIKLRKYLPEKQMFPVLISMEINNQKIGMLLHLTIISDEAKSLWGRRQFLKGEAVLILKPDLSGVSINSFSIIDEIRDRRYPTGAYWEVHGYDDRFIALKNGTVWDTKTDLMWAANDNGKDVQWDQARAYCDRYRGGGYTGWRMPTIEELAGIYDEKSKKKYSTTQFIDLTGFGPWSSEAQSSKAAFFLFLNGQRYWEPKSLSATHRALPVRDCY
ncbi:MAG: caspase family protein [Deltaproteobacteria bacterium]|nr:caspase family protein [Deltaproteobacteria bacterium]